LSWWLRFPAHLFHAAELALTAGTQDVKHGHHH